MPGEAMLAIIMSYKVAGLKFKADGTAVHRRQQLRDEHLVSCHVRVKRLCILYSVTCL